MEVGEVLLADRLREKGEPIDLIFAHHPEGPGYANLHEVMYMQADLWAAQGVSIAAGDALIAPRAEEIRRRIIAGEPLPRDPGCRAARLRIAVVSHARRQLGADVRPDVPRRREARVRSTTLVKALRRFPSTRTAPKKGYGPAIVPGTGSGAARAHGRRHDRRHRGSQGGARPPSAAGVGTLVGMHYSEEHKKHAEELKLNLVIAGHISSDVLGMNLVLDRIEALGDVAVYCVSRHGSRQALVASRRASRTKRATHRVARSLLRTPRSVLRRSGRAGLRCLHRGRLGRAVVGSGSRLDRRVPALRNDEHDLPVLGALADDGALRLVRPRRT